MADPVAALDDVTRREMVEHVCSSLREYVDDVVWQRLGKRI
jgi:hypothetical protein